MTGFHLPTGKAQDFCLHHLTAWWHQIAIGQVESYRKPWRAPYTCWSMAFLFCKSLIFYFQGLLTPLLSAFIPYYIKLLSILLQNYNPVATKTDIGRRKDEEGRLNCRWNTFGRKSHRQQTLCCFCVDLMFAFNSAFFHTSGRSCWKSFMVACKHMKKNTQVVQSANSSGSIKQLK